MGRTVVLGVCSDLHAGSTIGICPPEGIHLDDGGSYMPSEAQKWIWSRWVYDWDMVAKIIKREKAEFRLVVNGDAVDGNHHGTVQILSGREGSHIKCAVESLRVPLALGPKGVYIIRGTESHVGKSGGLEEGMAVALDREGAPIIRDPLTDTWSSWYRLFHVNDRVIDFSHHGRMGQRANTKRGYADHFAFDIWAERAMRYLHTGVTSERPPDIAVRSHYHQYEDTGPPHPTKPVTRVIQTAAYQLKTSFTWRVAVESLSDIGLVAIVVRPDSSIDVYPSVISPMRGEVETL